MQPFYSPWPFPSNDLDTHTWLYHVYQNEVCLSAGRRGRMDTHPLDMREVHDLGIGLTRVNSEDSLRTRDIEHKW